MKRFLASVLTAALLFIAVPSSPAQANETSDWWRVYATSAFAKFTAGDTGNGNAFAYGMATGASGYINGWNNPTTTALLNKLRQTKNPDGTYGLNKNYDAFADGTINGPNTAYSVTLSDHVGLTLLEGYKAGVVPRAEVQTIVNQLVSFPRVPVSKGACVAYSNNANDKNYCVHNVNSGVAWFLHEANAEGFGAKGMQRLISEITIQEVLTYNSTTFWWPYKDSGAPSDSDHNSHSAESMYRLAYWIGRESSYQMMVHDFNDISTAPLIYTRLASLPGDVGSWASDGSMTLWCQLANDRRDLAVSYLTSITDPARAAQVAYYAGKDIGACNISKE